MVILQDKQISVYKQLSNDYRAIDDFRAKLLEFLPVGVFGFIITPGLFFMNCLGLRNAQLKRRGP